MEQPQKQAGEMIKRHEGLKLKPYRCTAGKLTIGYGRNLDDRGITEHEAELLLATDLAQITGELDRYLPWWQSLPQAAKEVLVDMAYNLGTSGLLKFKKTLAALQAKRWKEAAIEMLNSRWAKQVGPRAIELSVIIKRLVNAEPTPAQMQQQIKEVWDEINRLQAIVDERQKR